MRACRSNICFHILPRLKGRNLAQCCNFQDHAFYQQYIYPISVAASQLSMTFINHYRWCGHHLLEPGMHMLRTANPCFSSQPSCPIPIIIFYQFWQFFLSTAFLRQKGNSLYLYWNVLSPFISAFFFPHCFCAAVNRTCKTFPSFLQE